MATPALGERSLSAGQHAGLAVPRIISRTGGAVGGGVDPFGWRAPLGSDLYVNAGVVSDGIGTFVSPWKTMSSARYASVGAGQGLWVRNTTGAVLDWVDCTGATNGTPTNPVVLSGFPGDPIPSINFTDIGGGAAGMRVGGADWHWWRKVDIQCVNWGICLANCYALSQTLSRYFTLSDCTGFRSAQSFDNSAWFSCYGNGTLTTGLSDPAIGAITVARCQVTSATTGASGNSSILFLEYQRYMRILGNLLIGGYNPLYFKHNYTGGLSQSALVKNNIFRDAQREIGLAADFVDYINNAVFNSYFNPSESGGDPGGNNCNVRHNTFYASDCVFDITDGGTVTHQNNVGRDNVWLSSSCRWQDNPSGGNSNFNQNNSIDYSAGDANNHWYRNGSQYSKVGYNGAFGQEANGVQGTCGLVGGTTPGSTPANWALAPGSVGIGTASDGGDRGVNAANLLTVN